MCADGECVLELHYAAGDYIGGSINFVNVPAWLEQGLLDNIKRSIRDRTAGPDSSLLPLLQLCARVGYQKATGADCSIEQCPAEEAMASAVDPGPVLARLQGFRDTVLASNAAGRSLVRLLGALSDEISHVVRREPLARAEVMLLLEEIGAALAEKDPRKRIPLTNKQYARMRQLLPRVQTLSPLTAAAAAELLKAVAKFQDIPVHALPAKLKAWRLPRLASRLLKHIGPLGGKG